MTSSAANNFLQVIVAPDFAPVTGDGCIGALTRRLVTGEEKAWREFHELYFDRLLRYLLVVCRGDEHAARESLQAALTRIVRHVRQFDREEAWWSWLTVVARSCVVDGARRQSRYRALLARFSAFLRPAETSSENPLPRLLEECVELLPAADRDLLAAKYLHRETTAALAASLGCTAKAVESRLARLRQRVRNQLVERLRDET
jgi:RNA polymerase sigma-70 factor, ECF subfamily